MNNFSAIAAAVAAAANRNASAGIGIERKSSSSVCTHASNEFNDAENDSNQKQHQIGTNLADLTVCWHRTNTSESCHKCGQPFYNANQLICDKCQATNENVDKTTGMVNDLNLLDKINPVNDIVLRSMNNLYFFFLNYNHFFKIINILMKKR